jgi:hypothetical protein
VLVLTPAVVYRTATRRGRSGPHEEVERLWGLKGKDMVGRAGPINAEEQQRCSKRQAETISKGSIAVISGIYNASPNCIQRANHVESPMRQVRRHMDATIRYPALVPPGVITSAAVAEGYLHLPQCQHSFFLPQRPRSRNRIHYLRFRWHPEWEVSLLAFEAQYMRDALLVSVLTLVCHCFLTAVGLTCWAVTSV